MRVREIKVYEKCNNYVGSLYIPEDCKSIFWSLVDKINYCDSIYFYFDNKKLVIYFEEKSLEYCKARCCKCSMLGSCLYDVGFNLLVLPKGTKLKLTSAELKNYSKQFRVRHNKFWRR